MPRKRTGTLEARGGVYFAKVTLEDGRRKRIELGPVSSMTEARALAKKDAIVERIASQKMVDGKRAKAGKSTTVQTFGEAWTSGKLLADHGPINNLKVKKSVRSDINRLKRYVYPAIGKLAVPDVTDEDIDRVMARVPVARRAATRQKVYLLLHRLFDLAIVPARLRKDNPVTSYHRPRKDAPKLFAYLYPDELLALLRSPAVPLWRKVVYVLGCYTGLRKASLFALIWSGVDLEHGTMTSTVSKTDVALTFEIRADVVDLLKAWRPTPEPKGSDPVIVREHKREDEAEVLRADLRAAGITRAQLFDTGPTVEPLRFHDLRATFVTWARRAGKSEGWITDRTGHMSAEMVARYARAARTLTDLRIEPFPALDELISEMSRAPLDSSPDSSHDGVSVGRTRGGKKTRKS